MGEVGANYARVWLAAWGFSPFWDDVYNYDNRQSNLLGLDETLESAAENGIYIQLTLLHHGMFSALVNPMWPNNSNTWYTSKYGANPYADILTNPAQFFTADVAKDAFQDMLQYIVARYGYSDHLMAWEIFNEVDWVEGYAAISGAAWHKQMAEFIQAVDPYDHLVTTSVKGDSFTSSVYNVFRLAAIDYVNVHRYGISDHVATLPGRQTAGFGDVWQTNLL
ncbi:MAG: glycoside hydrolase family 5 protein [Bacillus subtilis]|nr:glycoside hydrolase family 5 protein [Bacillus subtilis]